MAFVNTAIPSVQSVRNPPKCPAHIGPVSLVNGIGAGHTLEMKVCNGRTCVRRYSRLGERGTLWRVHAQVQAQFSNQTHRGAGRAVQTGSEA